jgi:glycosyltransferase involved in cell wall biosynthesis
VTAADLGAPLPKVSVLMPVYAAAGTLPFALRGLLAQTLTNLEVIVVDDASSDDTVAVAEAVAATDPRVTVLRQPRNGGSYAARNAGLRAATGDYITTHDADDWSHPQKIEQQVRHFLAHPGTVACTSRWIRCSADMSFRGLFRPWGGLISKSVSSLMFPREVMTTLGGWVEVRVGADTELMRRTEAIFGDKVLEPIAFKGPLAFSLHEERSLTRQSATHMRTIYHGVRKELQDAAQHWYQTAAPEALTLDPVRDPRPFPVPATILPDRTEAVACDLLIIGDLAMVGGSFVSTFNYVRAAAAAGRSVAVFHWRRQDLGLGKPLRAEVRDAAQAGKLRIVAPGERVRAKTVIVGYPVILRELPDLLPDIEAGQLIVVVNQMAARLLSGGDPQYDPQQLRTHCRTAFGTEGIWVPISGLVRRLMQADPRYPAPAATIWTPLIDTATWCADPPRWRGGDGREPVIGRHARDHYTKWPSDPAALAAAYCADRPCRVRLMGGAARARAVLGTTPRNWTVLPFGQETARDFLGGLDAFVHYPHEDYIEEFGRAVLEALACGLPTVLPPVFRDTFGPAALYAEPAEVWPTIARLWADEAAWLAQGQRGQDFVRASSDWAVFPSRLDATLAEATPAAPVRPETAPAPEPALPVDA